MERLGIPEKKSDVHFKIPGSGVGGSKLAGEKGLGPTRIHGTPKSSAEERDVANDTSVPNTMAGPGN